MNKISAIVVEDIQSELDNLLWKIEHHCPSVEVIASCRTGEKAIEAIEELGPKLVFLDIQLGTMSGFDVLERLPHIPFEVIFTTGYDQFAIQAFKVNALDYLLKPVEETELAQAVQKAWNVIQSQGEPKRIAVPIEQTIRFIALDKIMYCQADDNHTIFRLDDSPPRLTIKRTLGYFEKKLPDQRFFRIHRGHLVNCDYVDSFDRYGGGFVRMKDGKKLSVSGPNKESFLKWIVHC